jgi:hypothetical protein
LPHERAALDLQRVDPELGTVAESPIAVTAGGSRLLLGADPSSAPCYSGPQLTLQVVDGQTGEILDELPPSPRALDDEATRIMYGNGEVWCAR